MRSSHLTYLRRIIGLTATLKASPRIMKVIGDIRTPQTAIYQMMRDIVCDARFYSVIGQEPFWKNYSCVGIEGFIDSLTPEEWADEPARTEKKEDFLNDWFTRHIIPFTPKEQRRIEMEMNRKPPGQTEEEEPQGLPDGEIDMGDGVFDLTGIAEEADPSLPREMYMFNKHEKNGQPSEECELRLQEGWRAISTCLANLRI